MEGSPLGVRKGAWTEQEDALLKNFILKHGEGKWHQVPSRAGSSSNNNTYNSYTYNNISAPMVSVCAWLVIYVCLCVFCFFIIFFFFW